MTGNLTARRLTVVWSGAEIVSFINVRTDASGPSVGRNGSLNAVRGMRLARTAAAE
jgi:hypothetical protein